MVMVAPFLTHGVHRESQIERFEIRSLAKKEHNITVITPFKIIQGHRFWYQSKAHVRLPISD